MENIRLGDPAATDEMVYAAAKAACCDEFIRLDEATASVDPENEHLIQGAISELTAGKTVIVMSHTFLKQKSQRSAPLPRVPVRSNFRPGRLP